MWGLKINADGTLRFPVSKWLYHVYGWHDVLQDAPDPFPDDRVGEVGAKLAEVLRHSEIYAEFKEPMDNFILALTNAPDVPAFNRALDDIYNWADEKQVFFSLPGIIKGSHHGSKSI